MTIDWNAPLAPHFRMHEFVTGKSDQAIAARRAAVQASPTAQVALRELATVLEALRNVLGAPIHITSAARGARSLRDSESSQHFTGHAADVQVRGMTPIDLLGLLYGWAEHSPIPLRQCIAETMSRSTEDLRRPMEEHSGRWVHIAIRSGVWNRPASPAWATSVAPPEGERRRYPAWTPT